MGSDLETPVQDKGQSLGIPWGLLLRQLFQIRIQMRGLTVVWLLMDGPLWGSLLLLPVSPGRRVVDSRFGGTPSDAVPGVGRSQHLQDGLAEALELGIGLRAERSASQGAEEQPNTHIPTAQRNM